MVEIVPQLCSFYLRRPLRSLRQACKDIHRARGDASTPCGDCAIGEFCARETARTRHDRRHRKQCRVALSR